ncbi:MAG: glutaminyl-peptide cyclotransferase [Acidobacteriota bacterium]
MNRAAQCLSAVLATTAVVIASTGETQTTPVCGYTVVNSYPHDDTAYTQGLVYRDGTLFEGTGLFDGDSSIRRVTLETGVVEQIRNLDDAYFGEGVTLVGDRLIQLTWQSQIAFLWDRLTFEPVGQFSYTGSGWGLTDGAGRLIMSDGSSTLRFRDADTFAIIREVEVREGINPVTNLNELEFIRGEILANVYQTDLIARIAPDTGRVIAWIDLEGLLDPAPPTAEVLNGIAFDEATERLFVTGKFWPTLFEIELTDCPPLPLFSDDFASGNTEGWDTWMSAASANKSAQ